MNRWLTPEDIRIVRLFKLWLEAAYQGTLLYVVGCKCAKTECAGHVRYKQGLWPVVRL